MTGPVGKHRSPFAVALLSLLTLGVYRIIWQSKINRDASDFDFGIDVHPGQSAVAVAIPWIVGLTVTLIGAIRVGIHLAGATLTFDPVISAFQAAFLLPAVLLAPVLEVLLPFSAVAVVMTLERVRLVEARSGLPTDEQVKPASLMWVALIPLLGGLILIGRTQSRLNAAWERAASRGIASSWGPTYGR
jgi:hypothetical protein